MRKGEKAGKRTGRWKDLPPWPLNLLERIIVWPDGCWTVGMHTALRNTVHNEETGRQESARSAVWRVLVGEDPPARGSGEALYANCGFIGCVNPGHIDRIDLNEMTRRIILRNTGRDPLDGCPQGHGSERRYRLPSGKLRCTQCDTEKRRAHRQAHPEQEAAAYQRRKQRRRELMAEMRELGLARPLSRPLD